MGRPFLFLEWNFHMGQFIRVVTPGLTASLNDNYNIRPSTLINVSRRQHQENGL